MPVSKSVFPQQSENCASPSNCRPLAEGSLSQPLVPGIRAEPQGPGSGEVRRCKVKECMGDPTHRIPV